MANKLFEVSVKLFLKDHNGDTLILEEPINSPKYGFYDIPGGRIDKGEEDLSFEEILSREVEEELGEEVKFELTNKCPVFVFKNYYYWKGKKCDVLWVIFEANYIEGKVELSDEHLGFKWVDLRKIEPDKFFTQGTLRGIIEYLSQDETADN